MNAASHKLTPGHGEARDSCGQIRAWLVCPDHRDQKTSIPSSCYLPSCPTCWGQWANRAAESSAKTINGYREATGTTAAPRHVVLSPPDLDVPLDLTYPELLRWLLEEAQKRYDLLKVRAVCVIPHPYRIRRQRRREINDAVSRMDPQSRINRYEWALGQPNWYEYLYLSPHLHLVTYGFLEHYKVFKDNARGWLYANKGPREGEDIIKTMRYLLSHAWVRDNPKVTRYYRGMAATKLGCQVTRHHEPRPCPICGAPRKRIEVDEYEAILKYGLDMWSCDEAFLIVEERKYFVRQKRGPP